MPRVTFVRPGRVMVLAFASSLLIGAHDGASASAPAVGTAPAAAPATIVSPVDEPRALRQLVPAGRLIGMSVQNPAGENLGEIDDLVIDAQQSQALYAVIVFGGFLGLGENAFAYPLQMIALATGGDTVMLDVPRERLEQAPGIDRAQLPDWRDYLDRVEMFWGPAQGTGWAGAAVPATPPVSAQRGSVVPPILGATAVPGAARVVEPMLPAERQLRAVRASDLINRNIREIGGLQPVGQVKDLVLDIMTGTLEFAVVSFNRGFFRQDHLVTVPVSALRRDERFPRELVLQMTREQLVQAPAFLPALWPQFDDADFRGAWDRFLAALEAGRGAAGASASPPAVQTQPGSVPTTGTDVPATEVTSATGR